MTDYFTELLSVTVALAMGFPIMLYPLWEKRPSDTKHPSDAWQKLRFCATARNRAIIIYIAAYAALMCISLYIARQYVAMDINNINIFKLCLLVPQVIPPLIINRKRILQALFLMFIWLMYGPIQTGIGNYFAEIFFPDNHALWSSIISIVAIAATFPPLIKILRRICRNHDSEKTKSFWRLAWAVPATSYALIVLQGSYISGSGFGMWFISVRLVSYIMTLIVCYLSDALAKDITEAVETQRENEVLRARIDSMYQSAGQTPETVTKGRLTLKTTPMIALIDDTDLNLSKKEFALLLCLLKNSGEAVSAEELYKRVWGQDLNNDNQALRTAISRLRSKLGSGFAIVFERDRGYCLTGGEI